MAATVSSRATLVYCSVQAIPSRTAAWLGHELAFGDAFPYDARVKRVSFGRMLKHLGIGILLGLLVLASAAGILWWYFHPSYSRADGIVYGQRHGQNLTLDVVQPAHPKGIGIILVVSGGWRSGRNGFHPAFAAPLLRHGYTVFAVSHVSQPKATISEIAEDMHRAVRFIRFHAHEYGIDPAQLGVTGGSAGGHLSLLLATRGGPGQSNAPDPVDRASSAVQAVAVFYPITDLLNLGSSTENMGDGGPPRSFVKAFGPQATNLTQWKVIGHELSPIDFVTTNLPPTLIIHGGADTLVPCDQSQRFQAKARELHRPVELIIRPGKQHGWISMIWEIRRFADWFDHFLGSQPTRATPGSSVNPAQAGVHPVVIQAIPTLLTNSQQTARPLLSRPCEFLSVSIFPAFRRVNEPIGPLEPMPPACSSGPDALVRI